MFGYSTVSQPKHWRHWTEQPSSSPVVKQWAPTTATTTADQCSPTTTAATPTTQQC